MKAKKTILIPLVVGIIIAASLWGVAQVRIQHQSSQTTTLTSTVAFPGMNDQWIDSNSIDWIAEEKSRHEIKPPADNRSILSKEKQGVDNAYGNYTEADLKLWEAETEKLVVLGSQIFHDGDLLGSTIAVSCDMCHPDGSGTHPETYPKYQVQLGRASLLRDMINWCLENPCRGTPLSGDDPKMRAMEAYIQAQRTGTIMKYGKH